MISFNPITLEDKKIITTHILTEKNQDCDLAFTNLYCWNFPNGSSYAIIDNRLVLQLHTENGLEYLIPAEGEQIIPVIERLHSYIQQKGFPLQLRCSHPFHNTLETFFPSQFRYTCNRNYFDYIYLRQDLTDLKGKNYQPKRNHINKFKKEYDYSYQSLTPELIPECMEFEAKWSKQHGYLEDQNIKNERKAMICAFHHYKELDLLGGVLRVNGKIIAFTFGTPINHCTFGIHFEKADVDIDGAYSMINQEFASRLPEQYIYLNREEDLGLPGLRQAKLSYHPVILLEKCIATKINHTPIVSINTMSLSHSR